MSNCPDFNLINAVGDMLSGLGISSNIISLDRIAVEMSKVNGLLDFPLASKLLDDAVQFLSSTIVGSSDGFVRAIREVSDNSFATAGGMVAIVGSIATLGTQFGAITGGFMVEQLKRELHIRSIYYSLLLYHINQILSVLVDLSRKESLNSYKTRSALKHVKKAEAYLKKISFGSNLGVTPNMEYYIITQALNRVDSALYILRTNTEEGQVLANGMLTGASRSTASFLTRRFNQAVLGKSINRMEILNWNMSHIASLFPTPKINFSFPSNLKDLIPGYAPIAFSPTVYDNALSSYRKKQISSRNEAAKLVNQIREIDLAKGLVPTNVLISQLVKQLKNFDVDWPNLEILCRNIIANMSPALPLVQEVREDMEASINDDEFSIAAKTVTWIVKLSTVSGFRSAFAKSLEGQLNTLYSIKKLIDLKATLEAYESQSLAGKIPEFLVSSLELIGKASFNRRALEQALVYNSTGKLLIQKAQQQDAKLLVALNHQLPNMSNLPAFQMFGQLLSAMDRLPAPANMLSNAFRTGQLSEIMQGLTALTSYGDSIIDGVNGLQCVEKQPTPVDTEQERQRQIKKRREEALGIQ